MIRMLLRPTTCLRAVHEASFDVDGNARGVALILALTVAVGSFAETYRQGRDFAVSEAQRDREVDAMFGRLAEAFSCADASVGGISG